MIARPADMASLQAEESAAAGMVVDLVQTEGAGEAEAEASPVAVNKPLVALKAQPASEGMRRQRPKTWLN
jgi:hypothetical protein